LRNVSLISLDGGPEVPYCLKDLSQFPKQLYRSCAASLGNDKIPHVCGGVTNECGEFSCDQGLMDECYRYDPNQDTWTVSSIMFENKFLHACAVNSVPEIIINGGYSSDSTWTTDDGETFGILPPMPLGMHDHCIAALDDDDLFVAGYHNFNPKTFLYHSDTREWEQIQDMPDPSYFTPGCAMVHNSAGEQEVIVIDREYTQIFNLQSRQWRIGNELPDDLRYYYGTIVQLEDSFLSVGGSYEDTIYKYEKESDTFELLEARLPFPVEYPIAMLVDVDIFPSCPSTTTSATTSTTNDFTTTTTAAFTTDDGGDGSGDGSGEPPADLE